MTEGTFLSLTPDVRNDCEGIKEMFKTGVPESAEFLLSWAVLNRICLH